MKKNLFFVFAVALVVVFNACECFAANVAAGSVVWYEAEPTTDFKSVVSASAAADSVVLFTELPATETIYIYPPAKDSVYTLPKFEIPLRAADDEMILLADGSTLSSLPKASFLVIEQQIYGDPLSFMVFRTDMPDAQILGISVTDSNHLLLSVPEGKEALTSAEIDSLFNEFIKNIEAVERNSGCNFHMALCEYTRCAVERYLPMECVAYNPSSNAAIFKYGAAAYLPGCANVFIDLYIHKLSDKKWQGGDMNNELMQKLQADFVKKFNSLIEE